jgi:eukaryotic-like serine/threonine-protein kinase
MDATTYSSENISSKKFLKYTILRVQKNFFQVMTQKWSNLLLSLLAAPLLLASCSKNYSKDTPLPPSYSPSVIISSDNQILYALDPASGKKHWELSFAYLPFLPNAHYKSSPLLYNGMVYVVSDNSDTLYKINSKTGALVAAIVNQNGDSYRSVATPTVDGGVIYLACLNGIVYALNESGDIKWQFNTGAPIESSPTVYKDHIYIANTGGHIFSIDKTIGPDPLTGDIIWDYPGAGISGTGKFVSSIAIGDPYLFVGSISDSSMYCIYLTPPTFDPPLTPHVGYPRWWFKTNGNIFSSPAAYAGYCIFGSMDNYVYCLDTSIQPFDPVSPTTVPRVYWKFHTSSQVLSSPLPYNQVVYVGSNDQNLYAINMINGSMKWKFSTNGLIKSSPVAYGKTIFVGSYDKNIYGIDTATGTLKWNVNTNGNIECSPIVDNFSAITGYNSQVSGLVN